MNALDAVPSAVRPQKSNTATALRGSETVESFYQLPNLEVQAMSGFGH